MSPPLEWRYSCFQLLREMAANSSHPSLRPEIVIGWRKLLIQHYAPSPRTIHIQQPVDMDSQGPSLLTQLGITLKGFSNAVKILYNSPVTIGFHILTTLFGKFYPLISELDISPCFHRSTHRLSLPCLSVWGGWLCTYQAPLPSRFELDSAKEGTIQRGYMKGRRAVEKMGTPKQKYWQRRNMGGVDEKSIWEKYRRDDEFCYFPLVFHSKAHCAVRSLN